MKAMILAAGVGSRLDPLTRNVPKPMVPVVNRPVIEHIVHKLKKHGFDEIWVNTHYLGGVIKDYLGDGSQWGIKIQVAEEKQLWGDAGSVKLAEDFLKGDTFLVIGGDDISDIDISAVVDFHKKNKATATIALTEVEDPSQFGIVVTDETGRITRFLEKPKGDQIFSNLANTGVYVFEPEVFDIIPAGEFFGFGHNVFPTLLERGRPMYGLGSQSYWKDVGNIPVYKQTNRDALSGTVVLDIPAVPVGEGIWIAEDAHVDPGAVLEAPIVIGSGSTIAAGAQILANTVIGEHCIVEAGAVLKETILWNGAKVGAGTHLERSIVGKNASVTSNVGIFDGIIVDPNKA